MNTIKDDCKMAAAEELHDILAEADNVMNPYNCESKPVEYMGPFTRQSLDEFKRLATQPTTATAPATDTTGND
jgi:hypothetical protein